MYEVEDSHWWYVSLHELIISVIRELGTRADKLRILDAGCGTGRLCHLMQEYGDVSGFDLSTDALDFCRKRGLNSIFQADLNSVQLRSSYYDVITSIDTLYHQGVNDEAAILRKFHNALKPGGILILNLVAHEFLRSTHDIAVQTRKRYTRNEVETMIHCSGLQTRLSSYRLGFFFLPVATYRLLRKLFHSGTDQSKVKSDVKPTGRILNRLLLQAARYDSRMVMKSAVPFGTSIFAVAHKPLAT